MKTWNIWLSQLRSGLGNLVEVGEVLNSQGRMARFRYLQRYALVLITRGEGTYEDELGRQRSVSAGDWILVMPELGHCYRPLESGGWDELYVVFEGPVFDAWRSAEILSSKRVTGHLADPSSCHQRLRKQVVESRAGALERVCEFQSLLAEVVEGAADEDAAVSGGPAWFNDACRHLRQPDAKVRQVAETLGMGYETFRRQFKDHAGIPPHRFHRQNLINLAARLLDTTEMKSADVAETLGFCDEAYFSRVFKQVTGRSPRAYRTRQESH